MRKLLYLLVFITFQGIGQDITTIILVRHAEKASTKDKNPGLSSKGLLRAKQLESVLSEIDFDAIYSTNYKRTLNTIDPISKSRDLRPIIYDPTDLEKVANQIFERHKGETILISGHSNTTPALVNIFIKEEKYKQLNEDEYNWIYMVDLVSMGNGKVKALQMKVK